ncbi:MAG: DUF222 domain-containing protein [Acidimicrobiales bacterium]
MFWFEMESAVEQGGAGADVGAPGESEAGNDPPPVYGADGPGRANRRGSALVEWLRSVPPGPELTSTLAALDPRSLNGHELVAVIEARWRVIAHHHADLSTAITELAHSPAGGPDSPPVRGGLDTPDTTVDELRLALTMTRSAAGTLLATSLTLDDRLPEVGELLRSGEIDWARARVITDGTSELDDDTARAVVADILDSAPGSTTGQLRSRLARAVIAADPEGAARRRQEGLAERRVVGRANPDGTGNLVATGLPGERVAAIIRRLTDLARGQPCTPDDTRNIDQRRADTLLQLLDPQPRRSTGPDEPATPHGTGTGPIPEAEDDTAGHRHRAGRLDLRIDLMALIGLIDDPGHIPGWGPVLADLARSIALEPTNDQRWTYAITDPDTGAVLATGATRRRPTTRQRRHTAATFGSCIFPPCGAPATRSDLDHTEPYQANGPTLTPNLRPICRHDHTLKHTPGWRLTTTPSSSTWTTPHQHAYTTTRPTVPDDGPVPEDPGPGPEDPGPRDPQPPT